MFTKHSLHTPEGAKNRSHALVETPLDIRAHVTVDLVSMLRSKALVDHHARDPPHALLVALIVAGAVDEISGKPVHAKEGEVGAVEGVVISFRVDSGDGLLDALSILGLECLCNRPVLRTGDGSKEVDEVGSVLLVKSLV